jgi:hypothetical protein
VTFEEHYSAFPKLMGAPAYARPPSVASHTARPFDPDELPIMAEQTAEERAFVDAVLGASGGRGALVVETRTAPHPGEPRAVESLSAPSAATMTAMTRTLATAAPFEIPAGTPSGGTSPGARADDRPIAGRPFSLRDLSGRLRGRR